MLRLIREVGQCEIVEKIPREGDMMRKLFVSNSIDPNYEEKTIVGSPKLLVHLLFEVRLRKSGPSLR